MAKNNKNGFTMVELLAVIVILGIVSVIGIASVSNLIKKSREDQKVQQEKTVAMAAESYLQANSNVLPKAIGDSKTIKLSDLRKANYIQEDIENSDGESCMSNSYVRVYKYSKSKYTYSPYLYCGKEKAPVAVTAPEPSIDIKFFYVDENGVEHDGDDKTVANNVGNAHVRITLKGGKNTDNSKLSLDGYNYSVSVQKKNDSVPQEVYNSGTLSAGYENDIVIEKYLSDYIDLEDVTSFVVKASARNTAGGTANTSKALGQGTATYHDDTPPTCSDITNQAAGENDWKTDPKDSRVITLNCNDGDGSGCLRDSFSKTWPSEREPEAEYSWIMVEDNAGNKNLKNCNHGDEDCCKVRVNVDYTSPKVTIGAFKRAANNTKANNSNVLRKNSSNTTKKGWESQTKFVATDRDAKYVIKANDYTSTHNDWFNNSNYPNGVIYEVTVKDTVHLYRWEWITNRANTQEKSALGGGTENASGYFNSNTPTATQKIYVSFKDDGFRHGNLKVYDRAGNVTTIDIYANLDKVAPTVPNLDDTNQVRWNKVGENGQDHGAYSYGTWSTYYLKATFNNKAISDKINSNGLVLSGAAYYNYIFTSQKNIKRPGDTSSNSSLTVKDQGKGTFVANACDRAGNCSNYSDSRMIMIDTIAPTCQVTGGSGKWTNQSRTIKAHCVNEGKYGSGCKTADFETLYNTQIDTSKAGAKGDRKGGTIQDKAGNVTNCDANQTVKIDKTNPTCTVTGGSTSWITSNTSAQSRVIKATCSDSGGSGCDTPTSRTKEYSTDMNITNAGAVGVNDGGYFTDVAGNTVHCPANQTVRIDKTPPNCPSITPSTPANTWTNKNIYYTFGFTSDTAKYKFYSKTGNGGWSDWGEAPITKTSDYIESGGVRKIAVVVYDSLGNASGMCGSEHTYYIDKSGPSISCSVSNNAVSGMSVTDSQSGVNYNSYRYQFNNSGWGYSTNNGAGTTCGTTYNGYAMATDNVGNITTKHCGSYTTASCCDAVYTCREGTTYVHWSAELANDQNTFGTISRGEKMCMISKSGNWYYVKRSDGQKFGAASGWRDWGNDNTVGWIYSNCIGDSLCDPSQCPG